MRITLVLADTGRQTPSGLSLLQVGWKATFGIPQEDGSFTLPEQAVVVFIEAEFGEVNRIFDTHVRLVNEDTQALQHFNAPTELLTAEVTQPLVIPPVLGATAGSESFASMLFNFATGNLRVDAVPGWFRWICTVGEDTGSMLFRVNEPPAQPQFGRPQVGGHLE
jgi:hypothetical protein